jgi:hypothetical protein
MATAVTGGATCLKIRVHSPHSGKHTHKNFLNAPLLVTKVLHLAGPPFLLSAAFSVFFLWPIPLPAYQPCLFALDTLSQLSLLFLSPWPYRGCRSAYPKVTSPGPKDTCSFTDGINGNRFSQILKIVSKSSFLGEANKDWLQDSSNRAPAQQM